MTNKINIIKEKLDKEEKKEKEKEKEVGDESYINPNESLMEELKKRIKN